SSVLSRKSSVPGRTCSASSKPVTVSPPPAACAASSSPSRTMPSSSAFLLTISALKWSRAPSLPSPRTTPIQSREPNENQHQDQTSHHHCCPGRLHLRYLPRAARPFRLGSQA